MNSHYCDIFTDCYHCPAPVCPYEKYDENFRIEDETEVKEWERSLILQDEDSED